MAAPTFVLSPSSRLPEMGTSALRKEIVGVITVDGSVGGTAGQIPASTFGLNFMERSSDMIKDDNTLIIVTEPSFDGLSLLCQAAGTNAPANAPAGNYQIEV